MITVNRNKLLRSILAVTPGLSKAEMIQQSACIVMRTGRFISYNGEISCTSTSGLPDTMTGAVEADKLIKLLSFMKEEEVKLEINTDNEFVVKGKSKTALLPMEAEIALPLEQLELPSSWCSLDPSYSEAVDNVYRCCLKRLDNKDEFIKLCIHVHPDYLEASDGNQMARFKLPTQAEQESLVRASSLKEVVPYGMTKYGETENWLHFRNADKIKLSVRKYPMESYPPLEEYLSKRGDKLEFPSNIKEAVKRAALFMDDSENENGVEVQVNQGVIIIQSSGVTGKYIEKKKIKTKQNDLTFLIDPKLLLQVLEKKSLVEVTDNTLRIREGKLIYVTSLLAR